MDISAYARCHGYICDEHEILSDDGFVLIVHRIRKKGVDPAELKEPVLLMHGLFQSSGIFCTSGPQSLAFYMADLYYDVWLGNVRCVEKRHAFLSSYDPRFWDWSIEELGKYDVPAIVDFVREYTKTDKITYIGHSQGNAQAFMAMQCNPKFSAKFKCLFALAPAVYTGPLLQEGPISLLINCPPRLFGWLFGVKEMLPIMDPIQYYFPPHIFATLGYRMFNYLFGWTDTNWSKLDKPHHFRFTPRPTSAKAILHWCQMSQHGGLFGPDPTIDPDTALKLPPPPLDLTRINCPLAVFWGDSDRIIDGDKLVDQCRIAWEDGVAPGGKLVHAEKLQNMEHMDVIWHRDARSRVFDKIVQIMEQLQKE
ncbi:hypothetical protein HK104_005694 [Borealophlyctis nickersoniae]|nr:hypothetical protein HK104_005694 [Borealophlyctis nickersoniae]